MKVVVSTPGLMCKGDVRVVDENSNALSAMISAHLTRPPRPTQPKDDAPN